MAGRRKRQLTVLEDLQTGDRKLKRECTCHTEPLGAHFSFFRGVGISRQPENRLAVSHYPEHLGLEDEFLCLATDQEL